MYVYCVYLRTYVRTYMYIRKCDLASDSGQFVIVKLLEPKMVFVVSGCVECCV